MEVLFFFFGGLLAVGVAVYCVVGMVRRRLRRFSRHLFGTAELAGALGGLAREPERPKSLSGADAIYLPQILKDFPDFNPTLAETYVKERLEQELGGKAELLIHNIVISGYQRAQVEKTIIYQAALQYWEGGRLLQKRYVLHYACLLAGEGGRTVAANCPNCGAPVPSLQQTVCEYCGSRLANVLKTIWKFTEVFEE